MLSIKRFFLRLRILAGFYTDIEMPERYTYTLTRRKGNKFAKKGD